MRKRTRWSKEQTELLRKLWEDGILPASEIAKKIASNLTRNAVIGKANRMKFRRRKVQKGSKKILSKSDKDVHMKKILAFDEEKKKLLAYCNWPEGDPQGDDFSFCREEVKRSRPYCSKHMARAYNKQKSS